MGKEGLKATNALSEKVKICVLKDTPVKGFKKLFVKWLVDFPQLFSSWKNSKTILIDMKTILKF